MFTFHYNFMAILIDISTDIYRKCIGNKKHFFWKSIKNMKLKNFASENTITCSGIKWEYVYSIAVYQKYLMRLGELIIFEPLRENYYFSQPS